MTSAPADDQDTVLRTDVLVLGGGPAGTSAALAAAAAGAGVVLADKGWCGTSGAAASSGVGVWYVEPDAVAREEAKASREGLGGFLADHDWMDGVLDETYSRVGWLAERGYPFPVKEGGRQARGSLQGPELMRRLRREVVRARAKILDHSPVLELLQDDDGMVTGATGVHRQTGRSWTVHAGAVVVATGGCAFLSGGLGCDVLTGDGHLAAAEVGAELSGMEFSNAYAIAPAHSSVTKTAFYGRASFRYADGTIIEGAGSARGRSVIARTLLEQPVYAVLDGWAPEHHAWLRRSQPNFFLAFDRAGIDPFVDAFEVTMRLEGTVRGTGGLRIVDAECATTVPGLYAAGDAATRELICGGFTGGGSHNSAWALSSGTWAGRGAARHAVADPATGRTGRPAGTVGLGPVASAGTGGPTAREVVQAVQDQVQPYDINLFRTGDGLAHARGVLDGLWSEVRGGLAPADGARGAVRIREAAAMVAHARWMYEAAARRTETRGMHKRQDFPEQDPAQRHRLVVGGLDTPWVRVSPLAGESPAAPRPESALGAAGGGTAAVAA
ncbi:FAD-binding protein [Patulibacter sp. NPDC049589]|uniref:FAD-binding protein n=1 Tax=Patulibacter sp. NPDC049589 TaxID=3154731 RepID=UPI00341E5730